MPRLPKRFQPRLDRRRGTKQFPKGTPVRVTKGMFKGKRGKVQGVDIEKAGLSKRPLVRFSDNPRREAVVNASQLTRVNARKSPMKRKRC